MRIGIPGGVGYLVDLTCVRGRDSMVLLSPPTELPTGESRLFDRPPRLTALYLGAIENSC